MSLPTNRPRRPDVRRVKSALRAGLAVALAGAVLGLVAPTASAMPPGGWPDPPDCPDGYHPVGARCVKDFPPPPPPSPTKPAYSPLLALDVVRQTTDRQSVRIAGWTADPDLPTSPLTVDVAVDGTTRTTATASVDRPDVGAAYPQFGSAHGFDLTLPVSDTAHTIRVTAHNSGSGGDTSSSGAMDRVNGFAANTIDYDLPHAVILANTPQDVRRLEYRNGTTEKQQIELDLGGSTTETRGWQDNQSVKVSLQVEGSVGIPVLAHGKVTVGVEGGASWQQNGQVSETKSWSFKQMTTIPARSRVVASSVVTQTTLKVPYTMVGSWTYESGATAPGTVNGSYRGLNSHDMFIELTQTSLATGKSVKTTRPVKPSVRFGGARVLVAGHTS